MTRATSRGCRVYMCHASYHAIPLASCITLSFEAGHVLCKRFPPSVVLQFIRKYADKALLSFLETEWAEDTASM